MSGREMKNEQTELGVSAETVCAEAGVSMSTLQKVFANKRVRPKSVTKVRNALARLRVRNLPNGASPPDRAA